MSLSRRKMLLGGTVTGIALTVPVVAYARTLDPEELGADPFTLGVACGDPSPDGFVLWTRLAVEPLADNGLGGMPDAETEVGWELATDTDFTDIVAEGTEIASPTWGHSVHVEVSDLDADSMYYYRFSVGEYVSQVGHARTLPATDSLPETFRLAAVACSHYEGGYFNAYRALAREKPDLILELGDYIYEGHGMDGRTRKHVGSTVQTLANYRQRHAQYKTDEGLQQAHRAAPWVVSLDDHEVAVDWADMVPGKEGDIPFAERRENAFRAYYENMPLRAVSRPDGVDIQLYRRFQWGKLANIHMLDTRQYRDDQGCDEDWSDCPDRFDEERSILGTEQEQWLADGFKNSEAPWDLIGQQMFFSERKGLSDDGVEVTSQDQWDGYLPCRTRVVQSWLDGKVRNPIVLGGDVHAFYASEIKLDFDDADAESVGLDFIVSSITSGGDGADSDPEDNKFVKYNPHIKFYNFLRGFLLCTMTEKEAKVDLMVVGKVSEDIPDAKAEVRQSYTIADGDHTLKSTYSRSVDPADRARTADLSFADIIALQDDGITS